MWYVRDVLYAVLYVRANCFVVCRCGVSRRYIDVCYCDMFSVVNVYLDHLKLCVLIVECMSVVVNVMLSLMSVMCPPPALCNLSVRTAVKLCIFVWFGFRGELGLLNCDDVCMCVVNKQWMRVDERTGFALYQSCGDMGSVGHVSVFCLRWCG